MRKAATASAHRALAVRWTLLHSSLYFLVGVYVLLGVGFMSLAWCVYSMLPLPLVVAEEEAGGKQSHESCAAETNT
jgi:hypothetical protein